MTQIISIVSLTNLPVRESSLQSFPARLILLSLVLLGFFLTPGLLSVRASPTYVAGVKPGNTALYGQTVGRWNLPGPAQPPFSQFINLNFTSLSVTSVTGSNVTASQAFSYVNGTVTHGNILGSVATDSGNITFWFTAANLTVGDPIYTTQGAPVINSTMVMIVAGAPRAINIYNATITFLGGTELVNAWWDKKTGVLVHVDFAIKTPTANAFAGAQLVQTNIWNPSPNFGVGIFADPNPLLIAQGFSNSTLLHLISERSFSGNVTIDASIPACTSGCPIISVNPVVQFLGTGGLTFSVLNVSTTQSTGLGSYSIFVTARGFSTGLVTINMTTVGVNVVSAGADEPPTALIDWSPLNPAPGQTAFIGSSASKDPDGFIVSFSWTFGDGNQITVSGNQTLVTHIWSKPGSYNVTLTVTDSSNLKGFASVVIIVLNQTDEPPSADFFVRVSNPGQPIHAGQNVTFDGSPSFDPDGFITSYSWNFGDGGTGFGEFADHTFNIPGKYTVGLSVVDSSGMTASIQRQILVLPAVQHDVGIVNIDPEPKTVVSGQSVFVGVELVNNGLQPENVDLAVRFGSQVAATQHVVNVPMTGFYPFFVGVVWDTTGVAAGNYTISASVFLATDQNLSNNNFTDGQVIVLPPPVLTVTPSQGPVGTKVTVHGSGFLVGTGQPFQFAVTVEVTFDDQLIGFVTLTGNGSFDFVFDIPVAQIGPHQIHALAEVFPAPVKAFTGFTVISGPGTVSLTVSVGAIYFPGDTAVVYVLSTSNGSPANSGTISLAILLPNGTSRSLALQSVSTGLYRATYSVPTKNSIGTYGVVATSQLNDVGASALGSFEVKPTWLQSNGRSVATGTAIVGALGVVALAWRKGYLSRRKDEFPFN